MSLHPTLDPQLTGNVGLYYCCYRLSLMGWNVMPTARNARGVDVIAYDASAERFIGVQVKALSSRAPVPLGTSIDRLMGDYWVVVTHVSDDTPTAYVMRPDDVKAGAHRGEKDGRVSYWLQPKAYDRADYKDAWHLIGNGD